jgi:hypothetical protein
MGMRTQRYLGVVSAMFLAACSDSPTTPTLAIQPVSFAKGAGGGGVTGGGGGGAGGGGVKPPQVAQVCAGLPGDTTVTFDQITTYTTTTPSGVLPIGTLGHAGAIQYTLVYNFLDFTQPITQNLNLLCKPVSAALIQSSFEFQVTGTIDVEPSPFFPGSGLENVIHVHVVQIPTFLDFIGP